MLPFKYTQEPSDPDPLLDGVSLLSGYAIRAFRRHAFLAALCFVATVGVSLALLAVLPPTYEVETRILAKSSDIMPLLTATGRILPGHTEPSPTAGATEIVKSRETLTAIVGELDLMNRWSQTRTPLGRFIDGVFIRLSGPPQPEARDEALLKVLSERIAAAIEGDLMTITVEWHEPEGALLIANAVKEHFLAQLRQNEVGQIRATVTLLQDREGKARIELAQAARELAKAADDANSMTARLFRLRRPNADPDLEMVASLQAALDKKREALRRLEAAYDGRVGDAQAVLNRMRATLGPDHPDVADARRNVDLQSRVPTDLAQLRSDEASLSAQLTHLVPQLAAAQLFERMAYATTVDADLETARERYRQASETYNDASRRYDSARTELASAGASFPYRYQVTQPPTAPRGPARPDKAVVLASAALAALVLAFVLSILADVLSRRIQEPWQITRYLGLPVLGEVTAPEPRA